MWPRSVRCDAGYPHHTAHQHGTRRHSEPLREYEQPYSHALAARVICPRAQVLLFLLLAVLSAAVHGFRVEALGRRGAVLGACAAVTALQPPAPARADGGKGDKKFQECLSNCVYEATKITKGIAKVEVMSRQDAYAMCKPKCATSKDQLLLGQPKK